MLGTLLGKQWAGRRWVNFYFARRVGRAQGGAMQARVITETALRDRRSGMDRRSDESLRVPDRRALVRPVAERFPEEIRRDLEGWQKTGTSGPDLFERLISRT